MRDILKKVTTGAMIAGAALMVAACGGDTEANNAMADDLGNEPMIDGNMDGMDDTNMGDMNVGVDANVSTDVNVVDTNAMDTNAAE